MIALLMKAHVGPYVRGGRPVAGYDRQGDLFGAAGDSPRSLADHHLGEWKRALREGRTRDAADHLATAKEHAAVAMHEGPNKRLAAQLAEEGMARMSDTDIEKHIERAHKDWQDRYQEAVKHPRYRDLRESEARALTDPEDQAVHGPMLEALDRQRRLTDHMERRKSLGSKYVRDRSKPIVALPKA